VARIDGQWEPPGTGFFVSQYGFMLTAGHVIRSAQEKRGRIQNAGGKWVDEGNFYAIYPNPDSSQTPTQYLRIRRTTVPSDGDVAFYQLDWPPTAEVLLRTSSYLRCARTLLERASEFHLWLRRGWNHSGIRGRSCA
jgi:hypothetical protein